MLVKSFSRHTSGVRIFFFTKQKTPYGRFLFYGGESGIFTARFATRRPAAPLPLRLGHASAPASTGRFRLRRGPFGFESPKISTINEKTSHGRLFVYGGESGIFTARFATRRPAAPLPLRLGHASAPASTGRFRLRRGPFGFESPKISTINEKTSHGRLFVYGGESGIRTLGPVKDTAFRVLHDRPL